MNFVEDGAVLVNGGGWDELFLEVGGHGGELGDEGAEAGGGGVGEAEPEIDADGVVGADGDGGFVLRESSGCGGGSDGGAGGDPVHGEAGAGAFLEEGKEAGLDGGPGAIGGDGGEASEEGRGEVGGVEDPGLRVGVEADGTRKEGDADAGDEGDLLLGEAEEEGVGESLVTWLVPEAAGLEQVVGDPEVGVGCGVGVEDLPGAIGRFAPAPGGQALGEIGGGEVGFGPGEEAVEAGAIVGDQGEEHAVALALRGGTAAGDLVDDAALAVDHAISVVLPEGPGLLGAAAGGESDGGEEQG